MIFCVEYFFENTFIMRIIHQKMFLHYSQKFLSIQIYRLIFLDLLISFLFEKTSFLVLHLVFTENIHYYKDMSFMDLIDFSLLFDEYRLYSLILMHVFCCWINKLFQNINIIIHLFSFIISFFFGNHVLIYFHNS